MSEVFFIMRAFILSVIVVFFMQFKVGSKTIEAHTNAWIKASPVIETLEVVAKGFLSAMKNGYRWIIHGDKSQGDKKEQHFSGHD